jgi:hypothetical protein
VRPENIGDARLDARAYGIRVMTIPETAADIINPIDDRCLKFSSTSSSGRPWVAVSSATPAMTGWLSVVVPLRCIRALYLLGSPLGRYYPSREGGPQPKNMHCAHGKYLCGTRVFAVLALRKLLHIYY